MWPEWFVKVSGVFYGVPFYVGGRAVLDFSVLLPFSMAAALPVVSAPAASLRVGFLRLQLVRVAIPLAFLLRSGFPVQWPSLLVPGCFYRSLVAPFPLPGFYFRLVHYPTTFSSYFKVHRRKSLGQEELGIFYRESRPIDPFVL